MTMQNIYDNEIFFNGYSKIRENENNANNIFEKPALFSLLPTLNNKSVLDLGCGYGEHLDGKAFRRLAYAGRGTRCDGRALRGLRQTGWPFWPARVRGRTLADAGMDRRPCADCLPASSVASHS